MWKTRDWSPGTLSFFILCSGKHNRILVENSKFCNQGKWSPFGDSLIRWPVSEQIKTFPSSFSNIDCCIIFSFKEFVHLLLMYLFWCIYTLSKLIGRFFAARRFFSLRCFYFNLKLRAQLFYFIEGRSPSRHKRRFCI